MKQPVKTKSTIQSSKKTISSKEDNDFASMPKSQRGRKRRTPQEIREDMLKKLEDSNLNDND